jgi:hypothetical protein
LNRIGRQELCNSANSFSRTFFGLLKRAVSGSFAALGIGMRELFDDAAVTMGSVDNLEQRKKTFEIEQGIFLSFARFGVEFLGHLRYRGDWSFSV